MHSITELFAVSRNFGRAISALLYCRPQRLARRLLMAVSFATDIRPLFRDTPDIDTMKDFGLDLSSYEDVRAHATAIYERLEDGSMPCDGPWPKEHLAAFKQWMEEGMAP
jgi:hypothetical protein